MPYFGNITMSKFKHRALVLLDKYSEGKINTMDLALMVVLHDYGKVSTASISKVINKPVPYAVCKLNALEKKGYIFSRKEKGTVAERSFKSWALKPKGETCLYDLGAI